MIINAGLLIDFGNSETRVGLVTTNKRYRFNLSNKFAQLPSGYSIAPRYQNNKSNIFTINKVFYANGQIVSREFVNEVIRPSALQSKTKQMVTTLTLNLALIKATSILAQVYNLPETDLEIRFNISVLLPPLDHETNEENMINLVRGVKELNSIIPTDFKSNVTIGSVNVDSEAVSAFFGAFFTEKCSDKGEGKPIDRGTFIEYENNSDQYLVEVEENKKYMNGYVLVMDIGAGTTDLALFLDMELVERSKETINRGGNLVESVIRSELKRKFGYTPTKIDKVVNEAILEEGSEIHEVETIVTMAKNQYSKTMLESIRQYLEGMMIEMREIKGLLVVGGGAMPTLRKGEEVSPAMSEVLMSYLKELAPSIGVVSTEGKTLRELNIEGLTYLHKY